MNVDLRWNGFFNRSLSINPSIQHSCGIYIWKWFFNLRSFHSRPNQSWLSARYIECSLYNDDLLNESDKVISESRYNFRHCEWKCSICHHSKWYERTIRNPCGFWFPRLWHLLRWCNEMWISNGKWVFPHLLTLWLVAVAIAADCWCCCWLLFSVSYSRFLWILLISRFTWSSFFCLKLKNQKYATFLQFRYFFRLLFFRITVLLEESAEWWARCLPMFIVHRAIFVSPMANTNRS